MPKIINVLNTANLGRMGLVTCGLYFDQGELTSTNQIISEVGAIGYPQYGGTPYRQRVKWEPFGITYPDNSIRFARVQFRTEMDSNSEKRVLVDVHASDYTGFTAFNYDTTNYNEFSQVRFELKINGQTGIILGSQLTRIDTTDDAGCVRRYKIFTRPFSSMQWIWVELVVDVPSPGGVDSLGNTWTQNPIRHAEFWLRFGCNHSQRGLGQNYGPYNEAQSKFNFSEGVFLDIIGCESALRFESSDIYGKTAIGTAGAPAQRYFLHDHTNGYFNAGQMKMGTSKNWKGTLFFGAENFITYAERTAPITAVAENWGPYMPPFFETPDVPTHVAQTTDANYRNDWKTRAENLLYRYGFNNLGQRPHNATPYGPKPDVAGPGDQGLFGNAYQHAPLYHILLSAHSVELPYIVRAMMLNGFRPNFYFEADGTKWRFSNYPNSWIWSTQIFDGNGSFAGASLDFGGSLWMGYGSQPQKANDNGVNRNWDSPDRQHTSMQIFGIAAILTADYYALDFCDTYAELIAAGINGINQPSNPTVDLINGWESDRASARTLETLIPMYYASNNTAARNAIIRRYWLGVDTITRWRFNTSASIDKLDFADSVSSAVVGGTVRWNPPVAYPYPGPPWQYSWMVGNLYSLSNGETPFFYPWQQSFVACTYFLLAKTFKNLYPNGAYFNTSTNQVTLQDPGGSRIPISDVTARNLARDLAATVLLHCTWKFGPGGESVNIDGDGVGKELYFISMNVTRGAADTHVTLERVNYCFPLGGIIRGETSGTEARILVVNAVDPWALNYDNYDVREVLNGKLYLEKISGPGFINDGNYILENLNSVTNGYRSTEYYQNGFGGFLNAGWYGMPTYCADVNGTAHGTAGLGANYRKPLTWTQMLSTDSRRRWNGYTLGGWNYVQFYRDYGIWQSAVVTIVLDGLKENYYVTNDAVRYPLSRLEAKANSIRDSMLSLSTQSANSDRWDQTVWPFVAMKSDWRNSGYSAVNITNNNLFISRALVQLPAITTEQFATVKLDARTIRSKAIIADPLLIVVSPTNVVIPLLGSIDAVGFPSERYDDFYSTLNLDFDNSIDEIASTSELPSVGVITVRVPTSSIVNVVINLAMDAPVRAVPQSVVPEIPMVSDAYPVPTEQPEPLYQPEDPRTAILPNIIIYNSVFSSDLLTDPSETEGPLE